MSRLFITEPETSSAGIFAHGWHWHLMMQLEEWSNCDKAAAQRDRRRRSVVSEAPTLQRQCKHSPLTSGTSGGASRSVVRMSLALLTESRAAARVFKSGSRDGSPVARAQLTLSATLDLRRVSQSERTGHEAALCGVACY